MKVLGVWSLRDESLLTMDNEVRCGAGSAQDVLRDTSVLSGVVRSDGANPEAGPSWRIHLRVSRLA